MHMQPKNKHLGNGIMPEKDYEKSYTINNYYFDNFFYKIYIWKAGDQDLIKKSP